MNITCSNCKRRYIVTRQEIDSLPGQTMTCRGCGRFIRIALCPFCETSYAITYSRAPASRYEISCQRCGNSFSVGFEQPTTAAAGSDRTERQAPRETPARPKPSPPVERERVEREQPEETPSAPAPRREAKRVHPGISASSALSAFASAFMPRKLLFAAGGILLMIALFDLADTLIALMHRLPGAGESPLLASFAGFLPVMIFFFSYLITAAPIAGITLAGMSGLPEISWKRHLAFLGRRIGQVFALCLLALLLASVLLTLFGKIPLIGPVLYALLFLPIYLASVAMVMFAVIGFWFYPPVLAVEPSSFTGGIARLALFVKRHNFTLALIIPIAGMAAVLVLTLITLVHHGALSMALMLSSPVMGPEHARVFTAIPFSLQQVIDFPFILNRIRVTQSFIGGLILSHHVGGAIVGGTLALASLFIYSAVVSFMATASAFMYRVMEQEGEVDNRRKIEALAMIVLVLAALFLFKKIFL